MSQTSDKYIVERSTFGGPYKPLTVGRWVIGPKGREWRSGMDLAEAVSVCTRHNNDTRGIHCRPALLASYLASRNEG